MNTQLSEEEVERLTGYVYTSKQTEWLQKVGINYTINGAGKIVIFRSWIDKPPTIKHAFVEPKDNQIDISHLR